MPFINEFDEFINSKDCYTLLVTEDDSYIENNIKEKIKKLLDENEINTSLIIKDFEKDIDFNSLIDELNTYPMNMRTRFYILKNLQSLSKDKLQNINEYNEDPNKFIKVIYCTNKSKMKIKTDISIEGKKDRSEISNFIKNKLENYNIILNPEDLKCLESKCTNNRMALESELQNIIEINNSTQDKTLIKDYIYNIKRENYNETFSLDLYINNKNIKLLLANVSKTNFDEKIFMELGRITWKFRLYLKVKILLSKKMSDYEIQKITKVSKYQYKYVKNETNNLTLKEILNVLRELVIADRRLKSTDIPTNLVSFNMLKNITKIN